MTKSIKVTELDEKLADFTDRVLSGEADATVPGSDAELLHLEETALRLNQAVPRLTLDERTTKRMLADINVRRRSIEPRNRPVVWWSLQTRQRFGLALVLAILVITGFLIIPSVASVNGMHASAGLHPLGVGLSVLLVGVILLVVIWLLRTRK